MKRVYCLYRVSTKKQVDKNDKNENDIPMQKTACRDFASSQQDWTILKEFFEKGISGYKVSADDRDAIQELKEAALNNEFDILLVFMFDRIGRIDDEMPFVVEWFAKHGVEVWSTQEGQQCFNNHVDKLMNYLRFWQASGESEKTSIRIKSKMQQMALDGLYTGGPVKFGYRLADFLNKKGYKPSGGGKFTSIKVIRILRDSFYCGRLTTYQADRVDETIRQIIRKIFSCMDGAPEEEKPQAMFKRQMAGNRATQKKLDLKLTKNREQLTKLQLEIAKTLTGDSIYSPEDLSQAIRTVKSRITEAETKLTELRDEEAKKKQGIDLITPTYNQFKSWAEEFDTATLEQKKMIACHLFKCIEVGRDYKISVELNMSYQQFCSEWGDGSVLVTEAI